MTGSVPQYWVERARTLVAALPAGSPKVDLSALRDVQDPEFIRLRDAIQAHVISFDSNADRPARGEDAALDAVADEFRQLMRVTRRLGFSARMMISGHADASATKPRTYPSARLVPRLFAPCLRHAASLRNC